MAAVNIKMTAKAFFTRIHPNAILPKYANKSAAACDLFLLEDIKIMPGQVVIARTGIVATPPLDYHWELVLRSSAAVRHPGLVLANSLGIINPDYCGTEDEIKIILLNTNAIQYDSSKTFYFKKGERVAQLILRENLQVIIKETQNPDINCKRSHGGIGTTGK